MADEVDQPGGVAARIAALEAELDQLRSRAGAGRNGSGASTSRHDLASTTAALEASEGRYRAIVDSATDYAIITTDLQGRVTGWNEGAQTVLGWREDQVTGRSAELIFTPEDQAAGVPAGEIATARDEGRAEDERWHQRQDGSRFWASGEMMRLMGAGGAHVGYLKILRDRTAARDAQARMHANEALLGAVLDALPVGVIIADATGCIVRDNAANRELWGVPPETESWEGYGDWVGWWPETGERIGADEWAMARALLRGETVRGEVVECRRFDTGEHRFFVNNAAPVRDADGEVVAGVVAELDVTERLAVERRLRELNETLEARVAERTAERDRMWRLSTDLMLVARTDGIVTAVNPAWARGLGWMDEDMVGRTTEWLEHADDREATRAAVARLAEGHVLTSFENRFRTRDGDYRWLSWTAAPEGDMLFAIARDVTAEKERQAELEAAQEQLRQSQKLEAVGQLTGGVAHDFNNLLTVIRSSTDLLRRPGLPEERRKRYVDAISDTVDRAAKLTGQLLAFARRQALKPQVFDVAQRIRAVGDMVTTIVGARVQTTVEIACVPCFVEADASQFETAVVNMAVNARDAMDGEGALTIRVEATDSLPPIRGHGGTAGAYVTVSITDTGVGIAPGQIERIFEPFFTTKEVGRGTGLGLSQVFGFAKQSGGDVAVASRPGEGATFTLYLPRVPDEAALAAEPSQHTRPGREREDGHGRRVLVVEDNAEVGRSSTQVLQDLGYETTWAANAEEALQLLALTDGGYVAGFDVVFSDVVMPGMGGIELAQEIRRRHPGLAVVLTSGYADVLAEEGSHGFELLHKPYAAEALSRSLRRATGKAGAW